MVTINAIALAALQVPLATSAEAKPCPPCSPKPPAFILAGDSTTAVQSAGGGGWGNGFLSFLRAPPAWGVNKGHNGATTVSFVQGGDWANVTELIDQKNAEGFQVWVTVQFGHNDQKPDKNISLSQFTTNLATLAHTIQSHQAHPILLTPLTRRSFPADSPHSAKDTLHNERLATIAAAARDDPATGATTTLLDLNAASLEYVNRIGSEAAHAYNLKPDDETHLDDWGSVVFGRMVADLLLESEAGKCLGPWIRPNATLSQAIRDGVPA
ncbi:carbohydrate esterase family 12 protein [Apiospora saccharicola]|uniref:Carbohydrate esterase family 12 protein n=1 Tax=Apiospora saccharicola TaxID=335842 RepID=A0ABR1TLD5_9PEZI